MVKRTRRSEWFASLYAELDAGAGSTRILESDDVCSDQVGNRRAEQYPILCASLRRDLQDAAGSNTLLVKRQRVRLYAKANHCDRRVRLIIRVGKACFPPLLLRCSNGGETKY